MQLRRILNESISLIKSDGRRFEGVKAMVTKDRVLIDDTDLPIEEGDRFERPLPSGIIESLTVVEPGFFAGASGMAAHYQVRIRRGGTPVAPHGSTVYNVTGPNARVNVQSTDSSTNVVTLPPAELFEQMVAAVRTAVQVTAERDALIEHIRRLETAPPGRSFLSAYQELIATAADHMSLLAPFLPALAQLASR